MGGGGELLKPALNRLFVKKKKRENIYVFTVVFPNVI